MAKRQPPPHINKKNNYVSKKSASEVTFSKFFFIKGQLHNQSEKLSIERNPFIAKNQTLRSCPAMSNPRPACHMRPSLGFHCNGSNYILTICAYFDKLYFDIFDAGSPQCNFIMSVTSYDPNAFSTVT